MEYKNRHNKSHKESKNFGIQLLRNFIRKMQNGQGKKCSMINQPMTLSDEIQLQEEFLKGKRPNSHFYTK